MDSCKIETQPQKSFALQTSEQYEVQRSYIACLTLINVKNARKTEKIEFAKRKRQHALYETVKAR